MSALRLQSLTSHLYRVPLEQPVVTSFGTMRARWALWVCVQDADGAQGWGEVWCNFPDSGALHRCRLLQEVFAPLLPTLHGDHPAAWSAQIATRTRILRLQSAEFGPIDQCAAGIDTALWDLHARQLGQPLYRVLRQALKGPTDQAKDYGTHASTPARIRAYASGINPQGADRTVERAAQAGHRAFKVKVGFDNGTDLRTLHDARAAAGDRWLAADANQGWTLEQAQALLPQLAKFKLAWMEEPLAADAPAADWQALKPHAGMPLAAGENINHLPAFEAALQHWGLGVMQPDLAKWGGFTGCLAVVRQSLAHGVMYCPHYLGGGIGLMASAHLLAASGQDGLLEMDVNPNPLRTEALSGALTPQEGWVSLSDSPGLGLTPDLAAMKAWAQPLPD
jgi:L-alanine-DL-glutamate epimerase-like enolase superfamily enzyme